MSCAWNNYCIAVHRKIQATILMKEAAQFLRLILPLYKEELLMLNWMLEETSVYYYMDGLIFERDNYITLSEDEMERNGDSWIYYLSQTIRDENVFYWLKKRGAFDNIPMDELRRLENGEKP